MYGSSNQSVATDGFAITPSNTVNYTNGARARAIYVGGAGNVSLITPKGTTLTFSGLLAGSYILCESTRVLVAGTTATNLIGLL